jgi:3'-5' exoribonuclease
MRNIKKIADLDYSLQESIEFEATVLDFAEGLEESKRPMRITLKLEDSGEVVQAISWTYNLQQILKDGVNSIDVISFEALSGVFSNKQQQIRVGNAKLTGKQSLKKIVKAAVDVIALKRDFQIIISKYITTPIIKQMLNDMIMDEPKFFEWPASTKLHHGYEGGLALHTLHVVKNAISLWENYQGESIDIEVIVAAAMLHDYGKLTEYNKDGSRTIYGDLISHLVDGSEKVSEFCWKKGVNPSTDKKIVIIKHIILSHHEFPEFGAAVKPGTLEAFIVARSDAMDAVYGGITEQIQNLTSGQQTDRLLIADNSKILRWK